MASNKSGYDEAPLSPARPSTTVRSSRFSLPNTKTLSTFAQQFTQRVDKPLISPRLKTQVPSKKSGKSTVTKHTTGAKPLTILHAVPETRKMPILETTPGSGRASPAPASTMDNRPLYRLRSNSAEAQVPIKAGVEVLSQSSVSPRDPPLSVSNPKGRIQWGNRSASSTSSAVRANPGLKVNIPPGRTDEKALPNKLSFKKPEPGYGAPSSGGFEDVSPPASSKVCDIRNSIVSPLSSQLSEPMQSFIHTVESQTSKPHFGSPHLSNGTNSSDGFRDEDASSIYSVQSSVTSAETEKSNSSKILSSHERVASPMPVRLSASPPRDRMKSDDRETGHYVQGSQRNYPQHGALENDHEFKPTCALRPLRIALDPSCRLPSSINKPPPPTSNSITPKLDHEMGVITQSVEHPAHAAPYTFPLEIPSPTWSEAENDLAQELIYSADSNPFRWDDLEDLDDFDNLDDFESLADIVPLNDIIPVEEFRISRDAPSSPQGIRRKDSVTYAMPVYSPPPAVPKIPKIPRRSSKRNTVSDQIMNMDGFRLSTVPHNHIASQMKRGTRSTSKGLTITVLQEKRMTTDDFILSPLPLLYEEDSRTISPDVAEGVILNILKNLESLDDLFSCAVVNRGFYRVFKRNELDLMKSALRKMSPPAWEHREICYPGHDELDEKELDRPRQEYTAESYIQDFTNDMFIIYEIKSKIKEQCQSFLRSEISDAIDSEDPAVSARVDDALWRIWTFCKLFGSRKGREDDITAQMDWLQGGILVHQQTCSSSAPMWDDMNETLASAPECFAKGNEGGLSAEQLFDIMELWNCLGVLIQKIEGRAIQARTYGIFDKTDVQGGDVDGEEMMLDEWYYWLLAQGLFTIFELSAPCHETDSSLFLVACQNGLDQWEPPAPGSTRRNFLKQAASQVYEDKIAQVYAESSTKEVQRAMSKQRIQRDINDIRTGNISADRLPEIRTSQDGPLGDWEDVMHNNTNRARTRSFRKSVNNLVTHIPSLTSVRHVSETSNFAQQIAVALSRTPSPPHSPPKRTVAMPLLPSPPPSTVPSVRDSISSSGMPSLDQHPAFRRQNTFSELPLVAEHPMYAYRDQQASSASSIRSSGSSSSRAAFQQHPLQQSMRVNDAADNTAERAIHQIVEMGFTPEQARSALRKTDLGDGLRVDRAVELLLSNMTF